MFKRMIQLMLLLVILPIMLQGQTLLLQESFEVDESNYDANSFDDGMNDYFLVISNASYKLTEGSPPYTYNYWPEPMNNIDGINYFAVEDTDEGLEPGENPLGDGANVYCVLASQNISSYTQVRVDIAVASPYSSGGVEYSEIPIEGLEVQYAFDANTPPTGDLNVDQGSFTMVGAFRGQEPNTDDYRHDANLDGLGEGTLITSTFQDFSYTFDTNGATIVSIRIMLNLDGSEEIAFDNVRIYGVGATNTTPTISNVTDKSTNEDTPTSAIAVTIDDMDGDPMILTGTSSNQTLLPDGNISFGGSGDNRTVTLTPAANQHGTATITLTVDDTKDTAQDTFVLTVNDVNDIPTLTTYSLSLDIVDEDTEVEIDLSELKSQGDAADIDGTVDGFRIASVVSGTLKIGTNAGTATAYATTTNDIIDATKNGYWTPANNENGNLDALSVVAIDDDGAESVTPVTAKVSVTAVNDAPVNSLQDYTITIDEDSLYTFNATNASLISISDIDAGSGNLRITLTSTNGVMSLSGSSGLSFISGNGVDDALMIFDGTVAEVNNALDGLIFDPTYNYNGQATITINTNDGGNSGVGGTQIDEDVVTITINEINDAPVITDQEVLTTDEDIPLTITLADLTVTDIDNSYPTDFTLNIQAGTNYTVESTTITPDTNFVGDLTVPVTVNDGETKLESASYDITVTINSVNDAPTFTAFIASIDSTDEDTEVEITLVDLKTQGDEADVDGTVDAFIIASITSGTLKIGASSGTATDYNFLNSTVNATNNAYWTPDTNSSGLLNAFTTLAEDNNSTLSSSAIQAQILVYSVNDAPVITDQVVLATDEDTPITITLADLTVSDPDNAYPTGFTLNVQAGTNYTVDSTTVIPDSNFVGDLTVPVTVNDGETKLESALFDLTVTVNAINDAPVITDQEILATDEDTPITITLADLTVNDPDNAYPADFVLDVQA
ncbi:MAG: tandem-95 repeat protein, partial [Candidatus Delongbacteria bacterium]|nr:tandem-95 repeat protein [Candidatus Delongbacteria bacterium]